VRTAPAVRALHERYSPDGLIVVGVHTPEFHHEHDVDRVRAAIARLELPYPVAIDNDSATWRAFDNHYWPALYLIDKRGFIRHDHIGELHEGTPAWTELTALIDSLLTEPG
jgi:hypothetical protein